MNGIKLAFRTLAKTPFVTGVAVLSLALGIGANAAIFSLYDQILLSALPVEEPDRLVNLGAPGPKPGSQSCNQAGDCETVFSYEMFRDLRREQASFTDLAAHRLFSVNLAYEEATVSGQGLLVSGSYFPVLGHQPALGRLLGPEHDESRDSHYVAVLSHAYWERELGADPEVLNRTLIINGHPMTIVGVAPEGFSGTTMGTQPDVFVPLSMAGTVWSSWDWLDRRRTYWLYVFGRLSPDVSLERARAELNSLYQGVLNEVEAPLQENMSEQTMAQFRSKEVELEPGPKGQSYMYREARTPLLLLFAITGVVLLIACANIANLLLARGAQRGQEMAIRGSLGASRIQLLGKLLTESFVLAFLGGVASLFVAAWTLDFIGAIMPPDDTGTLVLSLRPSMVLFAGVLSLGTAVLFGLYPALHATRRDLATVLKSTAGQPSGARSAARFRTSLVTAQIALSMALLAGAGFFIKSLMNVSRVDLGLETENLVTFRISPSLNGYEAEESMALFVELEEELAALPGVAEVSGAMVPILAGSSWGNDVAVEGFESGPDVDANSRFNEVGPDYFSTLGIPLMAGREFDASDRKGAARVSIINEAFAEKFGLDPRDAVGRWMSMDRYAEDLDIQIVGVVQNARYNQVKQAAPPVFYTPYRQDEDLGFLTFYLRTRTAPGSILRSIPEVVKRLDSNLPVDELRTMEAQVRDNVSLDRMISLLAMAFAVVATILAAVGLYGVLAYSVVQRTREIGLRMALGARGARVRRMVLVQVGKMTLIGGAIGLLGALALGRGARSLLYELEGHDPLVLTGAAVLLALVALGAGLLPALRASRVDPMKALRYE